MLPTMTTSKPTLFETVALIQHHARHYVHVRGRMMDSFQSPDGQWYVIAMKGENGPFIRKSSTGEVLAVGHTDVWKAANSIFGLTPNSNSNE